MKIRDVIASAFPARFPDVPFTVTRGGHWELRVLAPNPALGFVSVSDDGEEATLWFGEITHSHFEPYDRSLSEEARAKWVGAAVIEFLDVLFNDAVVVWTTADKQRSGWIVMDESAELDLPAGALAHLWSRPFTAA